MKYDWTTYTRNQDSGILLCYISYGLCIAVTIQLNLDLFRNSFKCNLNDDSHYEVTSEAVLFPSEKAGHKTTIVICMIRKNQK